MVFFQSVFVSIGIQPMRASLLIVNLPKMARSSDANPPNVFPAFFVINFDNWSFVSGFIKPDRTGQHSDHIRSHANEILLHESVMVMSKYDPRYLASVTESGLNYFFFTLYQ